ncbi:MAG: hypothetical protein ACJ72N_20530 [Labedaea sp.]
MKYVLVLRAPKLGDFLVAVPALRGGSKRWPAGRCAEVAVGLRLDGHRVESPGRRPTGRSPPKWPPSRHSGPNRHRNPGR